jgi:enamine deaminase RidA (YjgF/YER057c/UK114 family)
MTSIELIRPAGLVQTPAFSHLAVVPPQATHIYIGGQNAVDADGNLVGRDDIVAQVEQVMANLQTALAAAGASMNDVISLAITLVDGVDLQAGYGAAAPHLAGRETPPLVTAAFVTGLGVPGALIELSALAAVVR